MHLYSVDAYHARMNQRVFFIINENGISNIYFHRHDNAKSYDTHLGGGERRKLYQLTVSPRLPLHTYI